MKKLILALLFVSTLAFAQEDYKGIAQETCDCIQKKDLSNASKKSIEMALGLCMFEVLQARKIEVEMTDGEAMRKFGEKVGVQMAPICPDVFSKLMEESEVPPPPPNPDESVTGVVKSVEEKEFLFITLKSTTNQEIRLVWLTEVEGAQDFLSDYKKLIGKKVTLTYRNVDLFNPKAKGYFGYKRLTKLELN
jgi:hypothetical protein